MPELRPGKGDPDPGAVASGSSRAALGVLFAVVSSSSYGLVITLARLAYDGGGDPGAVLEVRFLVAVLAMGAVLRALGHSFRIPRGIRGPLLRLTLGNFGVAIGYLISIVFIPVSLAVVIFYTYPLIVMASAPLVHGARLGLRQYAAFALAFAGLVLALGPSFDGLDGRGVLLALLAAVSAAYVFMVSPRVLSEYTAAGVALYTNLVGGALMLLAAIAFESTSLPASPEGWAGLGGVSVFYISASLFMFLALHAAGSIRTSLVFNLEPVVAIVAAALILGERLTPVQVAGVALVIGALMLASVAPRPRA